LDVPVYKKLTDLDTHFENPYSSKEGQLPVSLTENFWVRLAREGRPWNKSIEGGSASNTMTYFGVLAPSAGCRAYVSTVMLSCDKDAFFQIVARHGIAGSSSTLITHSVFAKAGTPQIVKFDGDMIIEDGGDFKIGCQTTVTSETGKVYASFSGIEVSMNG
jgi:hypothetical protein